MRKRSCRVEVLRDLTDNETSEFEGSEETKCTSDMIDTLFKRIKRIEKESQELTELAKSCLKGRHRHLKMASFHYSSPLLKSSPKNS